MARVAVFAGLIASLVAALAVSGAGASSGLSSTYVLAGIETAFPTGSTSTFGGAAVGAGGDVGKWKASVVHASLAHCPFGSGSSCAITGGAFSLSTNSGQLAGNFVSPGFVTPISQQSGCGKQVYGVSGTVASAAGTGSFTATLTHYRTSVFGVCVPYFATITGSLHLS